MPKTVVPLVAMESTTDAKGTIATPGIGVRCLSALHRRARYTFRRLRGEHLTPAVPEAFAWLRTQRVGGTLVQATDPFPMGLSPWTVGGLLPTLLIYGQTDLSIEWANQLLAWQLDSGSFPDSGHPLLSSTGHALRGLLAIDRVLSGHGADKEWAGCKVQSAIERAGDYLSACIDTKGRVASTQGGVPCQSWGRASDLSWLAALYRAAQTYQIATWQDAARRAVNNARRTTDFRFAPGSPREFCWIIDSLIDLEQGELAAKALRFFILGRRRNRLFGIFPPRASLRDPAGRIDCCGMLAHLARAQYKLAAKGLSSNALADAALAALNRRMIPGLLKTISSAPYRANSRQSAIWAIKHYLDASKLQVQVAFDGMVGRELPTDISEADGRLLAVRTWFRSFASTSDVADVGCGSGRFLVHLSRWFPQARLIGIDPSAKLLARLPCGVTALEGDLLKLPAADHAFDGAFAVESLEHSLLPEQAVDELCRIVRPGGRVLIIDKNRAKQGLSEYEPWERWFRPDEVAGWLGKHCHHVKVESIAHGDHKRPTGLFLCWQATRSSALAKVSGSHHQARFYDPRARAAKTATSASGAPGTR